MANPHCTRKHDIANFNIKLTFFRAFYSVVRQMPGYTSQRQGTVRTLPN